jgi:hypothetical protein
MERFNLRKLNDVKVKQHQLKISNWFTALENLDDNTCIAMALESIQENINQNFSLSSIKPQFDAGLTALPMGDVRPPP